MQTAVKWLQRACWWSTNSCRGKLAARRAGPLAELQTAAERQLDFASGSISWATSKIANSCRSRDSWVLQAALSAGLLVELQTAAERQLDFASGSLSRATSRIANSCRSRDSWGLQAAVSAGSLAELQTAADPGTAGFCKQLYQLGH